MEPAQFFITSVITVFVLLMLFLVVESVKQRLRILRADEYSKGLETGKEAIRQRLITLRQAVGSYDPNANVEWAVLDYLDRSMSTNRGFAFNELLLRTSEIKARAEKERQRAMDQAIKEAVKKQTMPMYTETTTTTVKPKKRKAKKTAVNPKNK